LSAAVADLPDYQPLLGAFHRGFAAELRAMIGSLPIASGDRVLDAACGDGAYSGLLADRVGPSGLVVAVDLLPAYLAMARSSQDDRPIGLVASDLDHLPFEPGSFDVAWCAQSLYSLPDPVRAVRCLAEAVRPGGTVALLENDTLHQILLPWPIEVELAVRAAEWEALRREDSRPRKFYAGRYLRKIARQAGLERVTVRAWATDRLAPLADPERAFFSEYLRDLRDRTRPYLDAAIRDRFERLADERSPEFLLDDPDLCVTVLDHTVVGVTAASS
jgi:ubiquinone/menaquinone biosynthesis C-methylase UbiE